MIKFYLIMILCLFSNCTLLNRQTKSSDKTKQNLATEDHRSSTVEAEKNGHLQLSSKGTDSLSTAYQFFLWPKGKVQFSGDGSFEGDFDSLVVKGNTKLARDFDQTLSLDGQERLLTHDTINQQVKGSIIRKTSLLRSFPDVKWIIAFLIIFVTCFYWLFKAHGLKQ